MIIDLSGMTIVITGSASGVGKAIAIAAAQAGASSLLISDVDEAGLRRTAAEIGSKSTVEMVVADLMSPDAATLIAGKAKDTFGKIDGLVNAAGLTTRASFEDATPDIWERVFTVNTRAPFFLMQEAIVDMRERKQAGSIVNIQSMNAHCGAPDLAVYSASKGALQTLTKNAANAHMDALIRVNGINLGWTWTESEHHLWSKVLGAGEDWAERQAKTLPLGRLLNVEDVARQAVFLLSPASAPLTGVSLDLDQNVVGSPG